VSATSAPQLVFEGPDPERLLLEAWSVHGTQVRISEPVTVRRGGVLGFFSKLHYRIEVLPNNDHRTASQVVGSQVGASQAASCQAVGSQAPEQLATEELVTGPVEVVRAQVASKELASKELMSPLAGLIEDTEDVVELNTTTRASFDQILEKVASSLGDDPSPGTLPRAAALATLERSPGELVAEPAQEREPEPRLEPDGPLTGLHLAASPNRVDRADRPEQHAPSRGRHRAIHAASAGRARLVEQLRLVGFPVELAEGHEELGDLEAAFGLLPAPRALPTSPGSLVAVVGGAARATQSARTIAKGLGVPADGLARVLPRRLSSDKDRHLVAYDPKEAADLSPGWRREHVAIVSVGVPLPAEDPSWVQAMLSALSPSCVLALASATTKADDLGAWCAAVGGVDGLLLEDVDLTLTPAATIAAGLAVLTLDGAPATGATWASAASAALNRRAMAARR